MTNSLVFIVSCASSLAIGLSSAHATARHIITHTSADAWKQAAPCWEGFAFDSLFPGLVDGSGCLSGDDLDPEIQLAGGTMQIRSLDNDFSIVCPIRDASSQPQVSDVFIESEGTVLLDFDPPITAFYCYFGSVLSFEQVTIQVEYEDGLFLQRVHSPFSHAHGPAIGIGMVFDEPVSRLSCFLEWPTSDVILLGAFNSLARGYPSLGTITIPGYQGPQGSTVQLDFAVQFAGAECEPCLADIVTSATLQPPPDGVVDGADLAYLISAWGTCP